MNTTSMKESNNVVVIGGGAAGMMAAGTAASLGAHVTLLEPNGKLGKKLFITGKGRCNVAQSRHKGLPGRKVDAFVIVTRVDVTTEFGPVLAHEGFGRFPGLSQNRKPAKDRPKAVFFTDVIAARA